MKKIRTILIEDEPKIRESFLSKLEKWFQEIEVIALCENAEEALEKVIILKPDLLFLDIEMPRKSGIDFLKVLRNANLDTHVIITTAYAQTDYLRQAMQLSAVDYLLKPILKEELLDAIERVKSRIEKQAMVDQSENVGKGKANLIFDFNCAVGRLFLKQEQIIYIKAEGNYSRFYLLDGKNELVTESMKQLEEKLKRSVLIRADRSHFINKDYVQKLVVNSNRCYFHSTVPYEFVELNETGIRTLMKPELQLKGKI